MTAVRGDGASRAGRRSGTSTTGEETTHDLAALFIFVGVSPRTEAFAGVVAMDEKGFVLTGADVPRTRRRVDARSAIR